MVEEQTLSSTPFVGGAPGYEMGLSVTAPEPWLGMGPGLASLQPEMRVLSILGTRPEAIKLAPVITELRNRPGIVSQVVSTGQHREMLHQALDLFGIVPDYDLDLMERNQTPSRVAASVLTRLEPIFQSAQPDWVLVQGDTTTAAAAAFAAFYAGIRVGHVEAGLRSNDKWHPFPEEINRRFTGVVADLHFAPTEQARQNLLREGIDRFAALVEKHHEVIAG